MKYRRLYDMINVCVLLLLGGKFSIHYLELPKTFTVKNKAGYTPELLRAVSQEQ